MPMNKMQVEIELHEKCPRSQRQGLSKRQNPKGGERNTDSLHGEMEMFI